MNYKVPWQSFNHFLPIGSQHHNGILPYQIFLKASSMTVTWDASPPRPLSAAPVFPPTEALKPTGVGRAGPSDTFKTDCTSALFRISETTRWIELKFDVSLENHQLHIFTKV